MFQFQRTRKRTIGEKSGRNKPDEPAARETIQKPQPERGIYLRGQARDDRISLASGRTGEGKKKKHRLKEQRRKAEPDESSQEDDPDEVGKTTPLPNRRSGTQIIENRNREK